MNLLKKKYANLTGQLNLDESLIEKVDSKYKNFKDEFYSFQSKQSILENKINNINSKILVWSEKLLGNNQCPYCKFILSSESEKKLHMKNCVYNIKGDDRELSIYSDPYKL